MEQFARCSCASELKGSSSSTCLKSSSSLGAIEFTQLSIIVSSLYSIVLSSKTTALTNTVSQEQTMAPQYYVLGVLATTILHMSYVGAIHMSMYERHMTKNLGHHFLL